MKHSNAVNGSWVEGIDCTLVVDTDCAWVVDTGYTMEDDVDEAGNA